MQPLLPALVGWLSVRTSLIPLTASTTNLRVCVCGFRPLLTHCALGELLAGKHWHCLHSSFVEVVGNGWNGTREKKLTPGCNF